MSPLRKWMAEHGHPGWYSWIVVVGTALTTSILSLVVSLHMAQVAVTNEREARLTVQRDSIANAKTGKRAACAVIVAQDEAFSDPSSPPISKTGIAAAKAWHDLRQQFKCDEE